jgi:N12 class adenine-specific DNA methylase
MADPFLLGREPSGLDAIIDERESLADRIRATVYAGDTLPPAESGAAAGVATRAAPSMSLAARIRQTIIAPNARAALDPRSALDIVQQDPASIQPQAVPVPEPVQPTETAVPLPKINEEATAFLRDRRNEALKAQGVARERAAARQEYAQAQPSFLRRMTEAVGFTGRQGTGYMPEPGGAPVPAPAPPAESSVGEQFVEPIANRIKQIYAGASMKGVALDDLALRIVEQEAKRRRAEGMFEPGQVVRVTGREKYDSAAPAVQEHMRSQPNFSALLQASWYESQPGQPSLEDDIHTELLNGLPLVDDNARQMQAEYYRRMAKFSPREIPAAQGFFQKLASLGGNLVPFIAELAAFRRLPGMASLESGVARGAGAGFGKAAREGATFAARAATVPGADPLAEGAFGTVLGGAQVLGRAAGGELGAASATGAVFGGQAATEPGSTAADVLITGGLVPLMFHGPDVLRSRFRPKSLARQYKIGVDANGRFSFEGEERAIPDDWRGLRDRTGKASQLIYRWNRLAELNPEAVAEIRATGNAIVRLYDLYQRRGWRDVPAGERIILETFVRHYDPAEVGRRATGQPRQEPATRGEPIITPAREATEQPSDEARQPGGSARPPERPAPEPAPTPERRPGDREDIIRQRPLGEEALNAEGIRFQRELLKALETRHVRGQAVNGAWLLGRWSPEDYHQLEKERPELTEVRRRNIDTLTDMNASLLRQLGKASGRDRQILRLRTRQIKEILMGLRFDRPDSERKPVPTRPEEIPKADTITGRVVDELPAEKGTAEKADELRGRVTDALPEGTRTLYEPGAREPEATKGSRAVKSPFDEDDIKMAEGERRTTLSGRQTTPFPVVDLSTPRKSKATLKRLDHWLRENAIDEAESRGDDFNAQQFRSEDPENLPPASKDAMNDYLFYEQPDVPKPLLKPITASPGAPAPGESPATLPPATGRRIPAEEPTPGGQIPLPGMREAATKAEGEDRVRQTVEGWARRLPRDFAMAHEEAVRRVPAIIEEMYREDLNLGFGDLGDVQEYPVDVRLDSAGLLPKAPDEFTKDERDELLETYIDREKARFVRENAARAKETPAATPESRPQDETEGIIEQEPTHGDAQTETGPEATTAGQPERPGAEVLAGEPPEGVRAPSPEGGAGGPPERAGESGGVDDGEGAVQRPRPGPGAGAGTRGSVSTVRGGGTGGGAGPGAGRLRPEPSERPARPAEPGREPTEPAEAPEPTEPSARTARPTDYVIEPGEEVFPAGEVNRTNINLEAIRISKQIEQEQRPATDEERRKLVQYTGWGSNRAVFDKGRWQPDTPDGQRYKELRELLDEEEFDTAAASTPFAMFTPPEIIRHMWDLMQRLGFKGGKVLEPGVGIGHFFGAMPQDIRADSWRLGVDMERVSIRIAEQLYPESKFMLTKFQKAPIPNDYFDLVIGNVPFARHKVGDTRYPTRTRSTLHDYYFVHSLALTRPGGIVAFITSKGTMDKVDRGMREYIAERADLVGAVRMNNQMLAGTKVTADIIVLQKRKPGDKPAGPAWTESKPMDVRDPETDDVLERYVNEYFQDHPEQVLGEIVAGDQYSAGHGPTSTIVIPKPDEPASLSAAFASFREVAIDTAPTEGTVAAPVDDLVGAPSDLPIGAYAVGAAGELRQVMQNRDLAAIEDEIIAEELRKGGDKKKARGRAIRKIERIRGMVDIRDRVMDLQREMLKQSADEEELKELQRKLNESYDRFVKQNNYLHAGANVRAVLDDGYTASIVLAIEHYNKETKKARKGSIFSRRVLEPTPESIVQTVDEALAATLDQTAGGIVDLDLMARMLDRDAQAVKEEAIDADLIYELPDGRVVTADEFLSGDSRAKLADMEAAAALDPKFERNVEALRKIIPTDLQAQQIRVQLGAAWVPMARYGEFADHLFGPGLRIHRFEATGKFAVVDTANVKRRLAAVDTWGTADINGVKLLGQALRAKLPVVRRSDNEGHTSVDTKATDLARAVLRRMRTEWETWIWSDDERTTELLGIYNRKFNTIVPRRFSGEHLTFPGMSQQWREKLREYQKRAVWRGLAGKGNMLAFHTVGSGKTAEITAFAMEARRRGIARKVLTVVQSATFEQFPAEAQEIYPAGKIYALHPKQTAEKERVRAFAQIGLGDWDLVVMQHSSLTKIPMGEEATRNYFQAQIRALEDAIIEAAAIERAEGNRSRRRTPLVRNLETRKATLEEKLDEALARIEKHRRAGGMTFEDMGFDWMILDEAQVLKNLGYTYSGDPVKGLGQPEGNQITMDAMMKIKHVQRLQNGRGVSFYTGTPITNSVTEMYNLQRYLQPDLVNANNADAWLNQFGDITTDVERTVGGKYKPMSRLRKFVNSGDLMRQWLEMADVVTRKEMVERYGVVLPKIAVNSKGKREYEIELIPISEPMQEFLTALEAYADYIANHHIEAQENGDNFLRCTHLLRSGALDLRLASARSDDEPGNKLSRAADKIAELHKESTDIDVTREDQTLADLDEAGVNHRNGRVNGTQIVFLNLGVSATSWGFSPYEDLVAKLVERGIPPKEIAVIHDHDKTREELFGKVNRGEVRVLIGTIPKLGIGVNVQRLAFAAHFLDPPWKPDWLEQAEGRVIRSGNVFADVRMHLYATEQIDEFFYDVLWRKKAFIDQATTGTIEAREVEEPSPEVLRYSEIKALTTGNPYVVPLEQARRRVAELESERAGWVQQQTSLQVRRREARGRVVEGSGKVPALEKAVDYVRAHSPKEFSIEVGDTTYTKREAAGQAIIGKLAAIWKEYEGSSSGERAAWRNSRDGWRSIATYRGFDVRAQPAVNESLAVWATAPGILPSSYFHLGGKELLAGEVSAKGFSQRIDTIVGQYERQLGSTRQRLRADESDLQEMEERLATNEWGKEDELAKARDEIATLQVQLTEFGRQSGQVEGEAGQPGSSGRFGDLRNRGGGGGGGEEPDMPAGLQEERARGRGNVLPSTMTAEQRRYLRETLDPTKPGYGMGAMSNIPDARNWWKRSVDDFRARLEGISIDSRLGRAWHRYIGRGLYGDKWGISEPMFGYFRRVRGARRLATFDTEAVYRRWLKKRQRTLRHELGNATGEAAYRQFEKNLTEVMDGKRPPDDLDTEARQFFDNLKARIDGITEETLAFPEEWLSAFGLENIFEVIRERMKSTGTHLRAIYQPAQQTVKHQIDTRNRIRVQSRGPRIQGSGFKPRRSDEGIKYREVWTLTRAGGSQRQFFDEHTAQDEYAKEIARNIKHYGESVYERVNLQDPFDRDMVASLAPIDDLGIRIAATLTQMEHNLKTLKLFDYIAETHAIPAEEGGEGEPPRPGYIHVPEHPTFGPLSNTWVSHHVWQNLVAHDVIHRNMLARAWSTYHYIWKSGKTVWNLGTWVNNILGDTFFAALYHMSPFTHPQWYIRAIKEIAAGRAGEGMSGEGAGSDWRYLVSENKMNTGFYGTMYQDLADRVEKDALFSAGDFSLDGRVGEAIEKLIKSAQEVNREVGQWYDVYDQLSIMAVFLKMQAPKSEGGDGMHADEAVEELWGFPNYEEAGDFGRWARRSPIGSSFIMFTEQAFKIMLRALRDRPGTVLALMALPGLLNQMSAITLGITDEEWEVINKDPRRDGSWGFERWMNRYFQPLIPIRGENGRARQLDLRWAFPLANDFRVDTGPGGYGTPLILNTPLTRAVGELWFNTDLYTGRDIAPEDADGQRRFTALLLNMIEELEPTPRMLTRTWRNLWDVLQNDTEQTWWVALAEGVFGAKIKDAKPSRQAVIEAIRQQLGPDAVLSWQKMAELYNTSYRRDFEPPLNPRSIIRGKVVRDAAEMRKEQQVGARRERIRRRKQRR